jgi:septal ring factor EnvC (AmiA/AmiB activator)
MIQYRYKKNNWLFFAALIYFSVSFFPSSAQRHSKNSQQDLVLKKERIKKEIDQINNILKETKANKKSSLGVLVNINMKLQKRQELINTIHLQIAELNKDIQQNENESLQLKNNLDKLKKEYAQMIVFAQRNQDAYSVLMYIFAAESFNQAYSRLKYMQQYSEFRKKQAIEIINTQTSLLARLNELKLQRQEKNALLGNEQKEKQQLSGEKSQQEQVLTELQKKEKELKAQLEKKKEDAIQLQLTIKRMIAAEIKRKAEQAARERAAKLAAEKKAQEERERIAKKKAQSGQKPVPEKPQPAKPEKSNLPEANEEVIALSADFSNNRGKLPWPVAKGVICETYGEHEHPAIKGFMMFNNGLEICATKGTQARAVFEGEVTSIAVSPTGGNLVIIRHGEYLSVYCNLGEIFVKTGQKVSVKQAIGTVLYNEDEDKTSMNLQIWKGQKTMDPGGWLSNAR